MAVEQLLVLAKILCDAVLGALCLQSTLQAAACRGDGGGVGGSRSVSEKYKDPVTISHIL